VPNRFTQVPDRPVPLLSGAGRVVLPLADAFMVVMASRPSSGSLATTWVTPATITLCAATMLLGTPLSALAVSVSLAHGSLPLLLAAAVLALLTLGSASVLVVAVAQRRLPAR